jgi:RsiW-degrading membrane proteinase PrsW (M82 family)
MAFLVSLLLGFIPMLFFAAFVNWLDRYEKEPKLLLGGAFVWGAIVAAGAAFIVNTTLGIGIYIVTGSEGVTEFTTASLVAPVTEELLKGLAVLLVFLIFRREFDSVLDGIIYAAITALGFAATENTYYIYELGYNQSGWGGLAFLAFIRIVLVGWQHPFYTAFFGIGLAIARLNRNLAIRILAPILGLSIAMLTHSVHNTMSPLLISMAGLGGMAFGSIIDWFNWLLMFIFIMFMIARERRLLARHLRDEVKMDVLSKQQYEAALSPIRRGPIAFRALFKGQLLNTIRFYQLCGELAHKKEQFRRVGEERDNRAIIARLRSELYSLSPTIPA